MPFGLSDFVKVLLGVGVAETKAQKIAAIVKEAALILGAAAALLNAFAAK